MGAAILSCFVQLQAPGELQKNIKNVLISWSVALFLQSSVSHNDVIAALTLAST